MGSRCSSPGKITPLPSTSVSNKFPMSSVDSRWGWLTLIILVAGINYEHEEDGSEVYTDGMECPRWYWVIRRLPILRYNFSSSGTPYDRRILRVGKSAARHESSFFWKENIAAVSWNARGACLSFHLKQGKVFNKIRFSGISSHVCWSWAKNKLTGVSAYGAPVHISGLEFCIFPS